MCLTEQTKLKLISLFMEYIWQWNGNGMYSIKFFQVTFLPGLWYCMSHMLNNLFLFVQAPCSCSCPTRRGSTRAVSRGAAVTQPPQPVRVCLAPKSVSVTTGPTTPCWPKHGAPASWETKSSPSGSSETSRTSAPTRTTGLWASGRTVWRKWTPAPPERHTLQRVWRRTCVVALYL